MSNNFAEGAGALVGFIIVGDTIVSIHINRKNAASGLVFNSWQKMMLSVEVVVLANIDVLKVPGTHGTHSSSESGGREGIVSFLLSVKLGDWHKMWMLSWISQVKKRH